MRGFGYVSSTAAQRHFTSTSPSRGAAAFTMLYTVFGGLLADAITDVIQGVMLIGWIGGAAGRRAPSLDQARRHRAGAARCRTDHAPARRRGTVVLGHRRGVGHPGLRLRDRDGACGPHHRHENA